MRRAHCPKTRQSEPTSAARSLPSGSWKTWCETKACRPSSSIRQPRSDRATCGPTPTGRIIIEAASGRMPAFVDTGLNVVHVDDVAEGHVAALQRGRIGERYILGGENVTLAELLAGLLD